MKLLSPPSISSSSTSSFDDNMCTSKSATTGCLAGILRRILCSRSLPTHPSDHSTESNSVIHYKQQDLNLNAIDQKIEDKVSPGIVAKLMGLDSMPNINLGSTQISHNSIARSWSMNSVDYKADSDQMQGQYRRVKSTLSFREMPTSLELENEEFFILCFENGPASKELRLKQRKFEKGFGELKQRKREKCENKENRTEKVVKKENKEDQENKKNILHALDENKLSRRISDKHPICGRVKDSTNTSCSSMNFSEEEPDVSKALNSSKTSNCEEVTSEAKLMKKKQKRRHHCLVKNVDHECSSQDSSPVSVLDFDQEVPTSDSRLEGSNPRRKLSSELENYRHLSQRDDNNLIGDDRRTNKIGSSKKDGLNQIYLEMWGDICRMTEIEVAESNWIQRKVLKHEDFEDINANVESQILDQLLEETVDQIAELPMKKMYDCNPCKFLP